MLIKILMILAGGGLGALTRYTLGSQIDKSLNLSFPVGIFCVNLIGCFLIGLLVSLFENKFIFSENLKFFLIIGFLGSLTTFSTFALDNYNFLTQKNIILLFTNIFLTNAFGLLMVLLGIKTIKIIN
ncbi:MAG: fluoride efflux transporter CrcB [Chloroflexota bacterium]|jgi:CrcB protein|nr:fluoride efflux transporter CrcB [Chloroflexota bacterium]MQF84236.1 fluoride efflux transporter CrcB [SAR202 cluster bacterium]MEC7919373.1 fluoride efflux transporter CrcB [Chloroflexota bacterium]MEC9098684.1 fluoride efflux transporter CrcB [Chloroflexota bacterium]MEC9107589.1 fluoride efflux transporter CrcB [Chloroflexota bacterium]|tara:strand:+ start:2635 stop:3015 length:381 start_codon:yes stop_codon:yes gene_type:complete